MSYPNFIDYKKFNELSFYKFYEINIVERNCMYPFTYNSDDFKNHYKYQQNKQNINDFIPLPNLENLVLDKDGLPFIPLNI